MNQRCVFQVVRVSGTIRKAEEEAIKRARLSIRRAQRAAKGTATAAAEVATTAGALEDDDLDVSMVNGIEDRDEPADLDDAE